MYTICFCSLTYEMKISSRKETILKSDFVPDKRVHCSCENESVLLQGIPICDFYHGNVFESVWRERGPKRSVWRSPRVSLSKEDQGNQTF